MAKKKRRKKRKPAPKKKKHVQSVDKGAWLPTQKRIAAETERIRSGWSETVRLRRLVVPEVRYTIPEVSCSDEFDYDDIW
jgi:hypothetical protein